MPNFDSRSGIPASASAWTHFSVSALAISVPGANSCFLCCKRNSSCSKAGCSRSMEASAVKDARFASAAILALPTELRLEDLALAL